MTQPTDAELLAQAAPTEFPTADEARTWIEAAGSLTALYHQRGGPLERVRRLMCRIGRERVELSKPLENTRLVKDWLRHAIGGEDREILGILTLDARGRLIKRHDLFHGSASASVCYVSVLVRQALLDNASAVVMFHNHPSGEAGLSRADEAMTRRVKQALEVVDVNMRDHVIVSARDACSMRERGFL